MCTVPRLEGSLPVVPPAVDLRALVRGTYILDGLYKGVSILYVYRYSEIPKPRPTVRS